MSIQALNAELDALSQKHLRRVGQRDLLSSNLVRYERERNDLSNLLSEVDQSIAILTKLAELKRKDLEERVESILTYALTSVFEQPYQFKIYSTLRGNQIRMEFKIEKNGAETDIIDGQGGGIVDVVSFVLRVVNLLLYKPNVRKLIILDEFGKHSSREYLPNVASLIKELSERTGIQFLIVTHASELIECGDVTYHTSINNQGYTSLIKD